MLETFAIPEPFDWIIICLLVIVCLFLAKKHINNGTGMSGRKITPRIPPQVQLPSLGEATQVQAPTVAAPPAPAVEQVVQQPVQVQPLTPATTPQQIASESQEEYDVPDVAEASPYDETYHQLKTEKNGELEFDLVSHRQRGLEKRYLNVRIKGMRTDKKEDGVVECLMNVTSKEDFQQLKEFFSNLNWDD